MSIHDFHGWGATAKFQESWVYDQGVQQYVSPTAICRCRRERAAKQSLCDSVLADSSSTVKTCEVFDEAMATKLRASNPEAFQNIVGRFLEANARGMWSPETEVIEQLEQVYEELGDEFEGFA